MIGSAIFHDDLVPHCSSSKCIGVVIGKNSNGGAAILSDVLDCQHIGAVGAIVLESADCAHGRLDINRGALSEEHCLPL